jgi:hypothetical protein
MRMSTIILLVAIAVPGYAKGKNPIVGEPAGGGYVDTKHTKITKDYYVVHKIDEGKCSIVQANWGEPPDGALGGAPYASKDFARTALKTFPECKGGESEDDLISSKKKHGK